MRAAYWLGAVVGLGLASARPAAGQGWEWTATGDAEAVGVMPAPGAAVPGPGAMGFRAFGGQGGPVRIVVGGPEGGAAGVFIAGGGPGPAPGEMVKVTYLGVATAPVSEALAEQLRLPKGVGLVVDFVDGKSPAAEAGVRRHDVLVRLEDQLLVNPEQLAVLVRLRKPGEKVALSLVREGREETVRAALGETERPAGWAAEFPAAPLPLGDLVRPLPAGPRLRVEGFPFGPRTSASASFSDGEHTLILRTEDGRRQLVATDRGGKVVFEGPIDTPEQRQQMPEAVRRRLKDLNISAKVIVDEGAGGQEL